MANRETHDLLGVFVGTVSAFFSARKAGRDASIGELLGGGCAGYLGSTLPDMIEPAIHPNHRGPAHSVAALAGITFLAVNKGHQLQTTIAVSAAQEQDPWARFLAEVAAGAMVGAPAGYASHLLADATTTKSLPVLGLR